MSKASEVAKAIKKDLKGSYPKTKFKVKSQTFPEGDAVNINWIDGPTIEQVGIITNKYQNDRDTSYTVKYINPLRNMSSKVEDEIVSYLQKRYKECEGKDRDGFIDKFKASMRQLIWREFYDKSY